MSGPKPWIRAEGVGGVISCKELGSPHGPGDLYNTSSQGRDPDPRNPDPFSVVPVSETWGGPQDITHAKEGKGRRGKGSLLNASPLPHPPLLPRDPSLSRPNPGPRHDARTRPHHTLPFPGQCFAPFTRAPSTGACKQRDRRPEVEGTLKGFPFYYPTCLLSFTSVQATRTPFHPHPHPKGPVV